VSNNIRALARMYGRDCKSVFSSLQKSVQILLGTRRELVRYNAKQSGGGAAAAGDLPSSGGAADAENHCFGCASSFVSLCTPVLEKLARHPTAREWLVQNGLLHELLESNLHQGSAASRRDTRSLLCALVKDDASGSERLLALLTERIEFAMREYKTIDVPSYVGCEIQLLCDAWLIDDTCWEARFRAATALFFRAIDQHLANPVIAEHIILPLFTALRDFTKMHQGALPELSFAADPDSAIGKLLAVQEEPEPHAADAAGDERPGSASSSSGTPMRTASRDAPPFGGEDGEDEEDVSDMFSDFVDVSDLDQNEIRSMMAQLTSAGDAAMATVFAHGHEMDDDDEEEYGDDQDDEDEDDEDDEERSHKPLPGHP
jgi:E3 ubiquitin-protein ligase UBR4